MFLKKGVTRELVFVTNEKTVEFLSDLLEDFCEMVKDKRFDVSLIDANNLSLEDKELFHKQLKSLTSEELSILRDQHPELFPSVFLLAKAMVQPDALQQQLIALSEKQTLVYRQQESEGGTSGSPDIDNLNYGLLARVKVWSLPYLDQSTLDQITKDVIYSPVSPGFSYDQFYVTPQEIKQQEGLARERALSNIRDYHERMDKRAQELAAQSA